MSKKLTIQEMQIIAGRKEGKCLSETYINIESKLQWQCKKGHKWMATPNNIKNNSWCPECNGTKKHSIKQMCEFAISKNGKCLSTKYKNINSKLKWRCSSGHEWKATALNVLHNGTWCPECAGTKRKTINDMKVLAIKKGGQCLSKQYKNSKTKLSWKCADGHKFEATPSNVKSGWWCPYCNWYKNEEKCRFVLEALLKTKFKKTRTLINGFEFDGYSQKINLAFEYNGEQHYGLRFFKFTEDKLNKIKIQDYKKKEECKKRGINLLIIPYTETKKSETLISFISNQLQILKISLVNDPKTISFATLPQSISAIKELKDIAQKKGGKCLSNEYFNSQTKLLWECEKGHTWTTTPDSIKNSNSWCPVCAGREYSIDNMNEIAKKKKGKCLSRKYIRNNVKLKWECEHGHKWEAIPSHILRGHWCPKCGGTKKLNINKMQELAKKNGGVCLSKEYKNLKTKLLWQCSKGHQWWATGLGIKHDKTWCPICSDTTLTIEDMRKLAIEKGGKCLSHEYKNANTKLQWKCKNGHQWWAKPSAIKYNASWCLQCYKETRKNNVK